MYLHCKRLFQKTFSHEVSKQAYMNACKWLAVNIYSNVELSKHIVVGIEKKEAEQLPAFVISVYVKEDEGAQRASFCQHCKMLHTIFYSVDGMRCDECKANAFFKKVDKLVDSKAVFVKEIMGGKKCEKKH